MTSSSETNLAEPFFLSGQADQPAVLLLHGFTGSPADLLELGRFLAAGGLTVSGWRLPGHGTTPDELQRTTTNEWFESIKQGFQQLRETNERVFCLGFSFGGNLCYLAASRQDIQPAGLISVNTPIFFPDELLHRWVIPCILPFKKTVRKRWVTPTQRGEYERKGKYTVIPLQALHKMYQLVCQTRRILDQVRMPALIIQSRHDQIVQPASAQYLADHLASSQKKCLWLESGAHHLSDAPNKEQIFQKIFNFINIPQP